MRIITICSGNVCRSPMAEYLLRRDLLRRDPQAAASVQVSSAGLLRLTPTPMEPHCRALLAADGIDASAHRSTPMSAQMVRQADLVLCFEYSHLERLAMEVPEAARRVFLITDFANICEAMIRRGDLPADSPEQGLAAIMMAAPLLRPTLPEAAPVADPYRRSDDDYSRAYATIRQAVETLAQALI